MNTETEKLEIVNADVVYQQDKAAIDMQIATAKAYPRNITRATENSLAIATLDVETAMTCNYSVPRGGKAITGPSVHLARILAQSWGNLRAESKVVAIDKTQITSEAICFDLENNLAIKTQVKRSIVGKNGRFSEDMITVTGNAANSIAFRNAVFAVIPRAIVDKVYKASQRKITGDVSTEEKLIARRKQALDFFRDTYGVSEEELLKAIGKAAVANITPEDIVTLMGIATAIKDGDTSVEQAFRASKKGDPKPAITVTLEDLKELFFTAGNLDPEDAKNIKRIIDNNEVESFEKAYVILRGVK